VERPCHDQTSLTMNFRKALPSNTILNTSCR
jgi:hypothetical protein